MGLIIRWVLFTKNQFIMSLQKSRKEVCRKEPNRQPWWWGKNLGSWHEQFQTQNAQITKALTVCLNCHDCFLIGEVSVYLLATSHGTFLGRLIDSFVLSGLLKGRVSWSVDGGDDLQLGWLQTLLQWPGGELIDQMAATSATSAGFCFENASQTNSASSNFTVALDYFLPLDSFERLLPVSSLIARWM